MTERYAQIKPANSRWADGWLISLTSISGYEMVCYPGERPFILTCDEWEAFPEYNSEEAAEGQALEERVEVISATLRKVHSALALVLRANSATVDMPTTYWKLLYDIYREVAKTLNKRTEALEPRV